jgi:hypothetical protein
MEAEISAQVMDKIAICQYEDDYVMVVDGSDWHPGVIGIVSSRITEQFGRPSVILSMDEEKNIMKGSGRSIQGFNLYEALKHCQDYLLAFGGHEQAAGLTLKSNQVAGFRQAMNAWAHELLTEEDLLPALHVDMEIPQEYLMLSVARSLLALAPFGEGNRAPMFLCRDLTLNEVRAVGNTGDHLKLRFAGKNGLTDGIAFSYGQYAQKLFRKDQLDVVFSLDINSWNGRDSVQLMIRDMKVSDLADNLVSNGQDLIHIDAFDKTPFHEERIVQTSQEIQGPSNNLHEYMPAKQSDHWGIFCRKLQESVKNNDQVCVMVNTREQCRHIKQLILFDILPEENPLVLHQRMDRKIQAEVWEEFVSGKGNPLITLGWRFLAASAGRIKNSPLSVSIFRARPFCAS